VEIAAVVQDLGAVRPEFERLVVVGERADEIALAAPSAAAEVERLGEGRPQFDRLVEIGECAVVVAAVVIGAAAQQMGDGAVTRIVL
jgi:hypothetical protein